SSHLKIPGYILITSRSHPKHGMATYIRPELKNVTEPIPITDDGFMISIQVGDLAIYNTYKPPNQPWSFPALLPSNHPAAYFGDFNSHHSQWGYPSNNEVGEKLAAWALVEDQHLLFDPKQKGTFHSAWWRKDYMPDLCFVSMVSRGSPFPVSQLVLDTFPHSQHRPVIIHIGLKVPIITSAPIPCWNLRRADWPAFMAATEEMIGHLPATPENFEHFTKLLKKVAKKNIPHGYRSFFTLCWSPESETLLREYETSGDLDVTTVLLESLDSARQLRWTEAMENMDFTHSSQKAWNLLRCLGGAAPAQHQTPSVTANSISSQILNNSKTIASRSMNRALTQCAPFSSLSEPFSRAEINSALSATKRGKAAGMDGILLDLLKNLSPRGRDWLAALFTKIF
uniref:Endonuclease/exonuclease/phosphatase domain-containing protein n=1 Tax=Latimeria chalumnae TaxID=7897 RepID=H3APE4_LATCH